jgi:cephalosporin hydroxylase
MTLATIYRNLALACLCCVAVLGVACNRRHKATEKPAAATAGTTPATTTTDDQFAVSNFMVGDKLLEKRLLRGFYEATGVWRWTAPKFAVSLDVPQPLAPMFLEMDFTLPDEVMKQVPAVTLFARVNHQRIARKDYNKAGRYYFSNNVPLDLLKTSPVEIEFEVDKSIKDAEHGGRSLALIVVGIGLKYYEEPKVGPEREAQLSREGYKQLLAQRRLTMPLDKQNDLMKLFHDLPVWKQTWFHNVPIDKNPLDLWMMQQIMYELQPDFVVETGTYKGGSALYWAHTLNGLGLENSRVLTVDITDFTKGAVAHPLWKKYVTFYLGSSTDPAIVAQIAQKVKGKKVIVTLDSDHTMNHVLQELKMYAPLVNKGSYLIVEDTHMDGVPTAPGFGPGPLAAVRKFLADGGSKDFQPDPTREAYVMTFNPGGWLRRK